MHIAVIPHAFEPYSAIQTYQQELTDAGKIGATCLFIGSMRDFNQGDDVVAMTLEHYAGMTEKYLARIVQTAQSRWAIHDALVLHRVGEITPQDTIVVVAIWSAQRGDAFDACRFIIEELKSNAPFWKKELLRNQTTRWVEHNSSGYAQEQA